MTGMPEQFSDRSMPKITYIHTIVCDLCYKKYVDLQGGIMNVPICLDLYEHKEGFE